MGFTRHNDWSFQENYRWRELKRTVVNLLPTMNSLDRVDNNASNISWHWSLWKQGSQLQPLIKRKTKQKGKTTEETEPDSNLIPHSNLTRVRTWLVQRVNSYYFVQTCDITTVFVACPWSTLLSYIIDRKRSPLCYVDCCYVWSKLYWDIRLLGTQWFCTERHYPPQKFGFNCDEKIIP